MPLIYLQSGERDRLIVADGLAEVDAQGTTVAGTLLVKADSGGVVEALGEGQAQIVAAEVLADGLGQADVQGSATAGLLTASADAQGLVEALGEGVGETIGAIIVADGQADVDAQGSATAGTLLITASASGVAEAVGAGGGQAIIVKVLADGLAEVDVQGSATAKKLEIAASDSITDDDVSALDDGSTKTVRIFDSGGTQVGGDDSSLFEGTSSQKDNSSELRWTNGSGSTASVESVEILDGTTLLASGSIGPYSVDDGVDLYYSAADLVVNELA